MLFLYLPIPGITVLGELAQIHRGCSHFHSPNTKITQGVAVHSILFLHIYHKNILLCSSSVLPWHPGAVRDESTRNLLCCTLTTGEGKGFSTLKESCRFSGKSHSFKHSTSPICLNVGLGSHISLSCANKYLCRLPSLNCENLLPGQSGQYSSHERAQENSEGKNQQKRGSFWAAAELCRIPEAPSRHHWTVTALAVKVFERAGFATPGMGNFSRYSISCPDVM